MGLRFYKRVHLFPGVSVNVSGSGPSLTFGVRGAHVTVGRKGITRTVGLPGTGIYYTSRRGYHSGIHSAYGDQPRTPTDQMNADRRAELTIGILAVTVIALLVLLAIAIHK
ncbi:MAG TPA: DUF4236 domain-containing protein [Candidatus Binataceae bacterium]|nr:DUF4236 domain-containing protein [Candidatus Binataceae bacterium]